MSQHNIYAAAFLLSLVFGCATPYTDPEPKASQACKNTLCQKQKEKECKPKETTLYDFTVGCRDRPVKGRIYRHANGNIKVFQVIREKVDDKKEELTWVLATGGELCIGVINDREYVTGEYLLMGEYRYIGPITYNTSPIINGVRTESTNTVRLFVEVGSTFDKCYLESIRK